MSKKALAIISIGSFVTLNAAHAGSFPAQNYGDAFSNSLNNTQGIILRQRQLEQIDRDQVYQDQLLKIENERLRLEQERFEAEKRREQEKADRAAAHKMAEDIVFERFCDMHPEFRNSESKVRKYGDYVFETKYAGAVAKGTMTYMDALKATAMDVNEVIPFESVPQSAVKTATPQVPDGFVLDKPATPHN